MNKIVIALCLLLSSYCFAADSALRNVSLTVSGVVALPAPSVNLTCTPPATGPVPNSYNFYRSNVSGSGYVLLGSNSGCSYVDSNVAWATTYFYVATAVNTATCPAGFTCESIFSNQTSGTVPVNPIPGPPTNLGNQVSAKNRVPLFWEPPVPGPVTAYRMLRRPHNQLNWQQVAGGINGTRWTDTRVKSGTWDYAAQSVHYFQGFNYVSVLSNVDVVRVP
jgi:hypothetical protein